ncbi:hypothetical protein E2C01_076129 [Portunus trituberculatus]|uniref:Uncharacterized protein n=1 Tax=Portunus trituberculatus TaxID=210409 RepID=A0A5B7IL85_PORTR|nr:hypothetical protein [Portunus trituberculatus]
MHSRHFSRRADELSPGPREALQFPPTPRYPTHPQRTLLKLKISEETLRPSHPERFTWSLRGLSLVRWDAGGASCRDQPVFTVKASWRLPGRELHEDRDEDDDEGRSRRNIWLADENWRLWIWRKHSNVGWLYGALFIPKTPPVRYPLPKLSQTP